MTLDMNDEYLVTIKQLERFVQSSVGIVYSRAKRKAKYSWVDKILTRFMYKTLSKKNKMVVRAYLIRITGYSRSQLTRLIEKKRETKTVSTRAAQTHRVVHLVLADAREVRVSPNHPMETGVPIGALRIGDIVAGSRVVRTELIPYDDRFTYDLLPDSDTRVYWADGIPLRSTIVH